ncbi:hypothetical protein CPC08DRAFT_650423 [Agrocybe pediades]|nr:hypothetical protein CPC08DRAFT_650423 [Agrocybe pediades]
MLEFILEYRKVIERFTADRKNDIRELELFDDEWEVVKQLSEVLKHATLFFSRAKANIANVIPTMDHINDSFTSKANDPNYSPAIRAALGLAKKTLNRYYSRTDDSEAYRIAMILHPQYKMQYFKDAKWEDSWVSTAEHLLRTRYKASYQIDKPTDTSNAGTSTKVRVIHFILFFEQVSNFSVSS